MIVIFYILLGWFILGLLFKLLAPWLLRMVARYAQRRMERQVNDMFNTSAQSTYNNRNNAPRQPEPSPRSKKIDPEVGEYVHFEEMGASNNAKKDAPRPNVDYRIEDQVVDIEWEDIPDKK